MSTTAPAPAATSTSQVLERAVAAQAARRRADVEVLDAALAWAHAHVMSVEDDPALVAGWRTDTIHTPGTPATPGSPAALFGERPVPLAGAGTPLVAEFAVIELAAVLDQSHEATLMLLGDALDLAHRLPRLWALVRQLEVPVRLAREAATASRDLDPAAAAHADRLLAWQPRRLNPHRIGVLVHEARLYADPDRAIADHDHALATRRVEVHHDEGAPGTSAVFMTLDTTDAISFDHTVTTMAATMRSLGHHGDLGVRRAHAVGLLADPQKALDLLAAADITDPDRPVPVDDDPAICVAEDAAYATPSPFRRPGADTRDASGEVTLVVHVTDRDLLAGQHTTNASIDTRGVARSEELGPMLIGRLRSWLLTAAKVTIQPVLDLDPHTPTIPAVDQHDPPAPMAAAVRLRDETCVYPHCGRSSQRCDLDHIIDYVPLDQGGPPGQTHPANLAPLCRRHHRAKTFSHYTYARLPDGSYHWTLPTGTQVTTDPPTPRPRPEPPHRP